MPFPYVVSNIPTYLFQESLLNLHIRVFCFTALIPFVTDASHTYPGVFLFFSFIPLSFSFPSSFLFEFDSFHSSLGSHHLFQFVPMFLLVQCLVPKWYFFYFFLIILSHIAFFSGCFVCNSNMLFFHSSLHCLNIVPLFWKSRLGFCEFLWHAFLALFVLSVSYSLVIFIVIT